ncbi:MAG: hypothetical protein K0B02_02570 [DPANN group archaeon]|nr:hypothetical protein [DPANN group archaeon]
MDNLKPGQIIDMNGEENSSLFYKLLKDVINQTNFDEIQTKVNNYLKKYEDDSTPNS